MAVLKVKVNGVWKDISYTESGNIYNDHIKDKNNPHNVTKSQIGLNNVENKSSDEIRSEITKENITDALGYTPPTTNTTYGVVSTTSDGLAPKRDGSTTKFLRGDGTWAVPPDNNTTYSAATTSTDGLMTSTMVTKLNGIDTGANKTTVDTALSTTSTNPVQNKVITTKINNLFSYGTSDLTAGSSSLETGKLYFVYE